MSQLLDRVAFRRDSDNLICVVTWSDDISAQRDLDDGMQYQIEIGNISILEFTFEYFKDNGEFEGRDYLGSCEFSKDATDKDYTKFAIEHC
jgi:hypothetical protein